MYDEMSDGAKFAVAAGLMVAGGAVAWWIAKPGDKTAGGPGDNPIWGAVKTPALGKSPYHRIGDIVRVGGANYKVEAVPATGHLDELQYAYGQAFHMHAEALNSLSGYYRVGELVKIGGALYRITLVPFTDQLAPNIASATAHAGR